MTDSELGKVLDERYLGEDPIKNGVWLTVMDRDRLKSFLNGGARLEVATAWATAANMKLTDRADDWFEVSVGIANLGNADSYEAEIWIVLWAPGKTGTFRHRVRKSIAVEETIKEVVHVRLAQVQESPAGKIERTEEITHIHALVHDRTLDPFDNVARDLLRDARAGTQDLAENPMRLSRQIDCIAVGDISVTGRELAADREAVYEVALTKCTWADATKLGVEDSSTAEWLRGLNNKSDQNVVLGRYRVPQGHIVFWLKANASRLLSNDIRRCKIAKPDSGALELMWEAGSDGDFDDFVFFMTRR